MSDNPWFPKDFADFIECEMLGSTVVGKYNVSTVRTPKFKGEPDKFETVIFGLSDYPIWHATRWSAIAEHRVIVDVLTRLEKRAP